ncbi:hypothetical protein SGPA1_50306 [Streptomyces misionensis JCM 4497]
MPPDPAVHAVLAVPSVSLRHQTHAVRHQTSGAALPVRRTPQAGWSPGAPGEADGYCTGFA